MRKIFISENKVWNAHLVQKPDLDNNGGQVHWRSKLCLRQLQESGSCEVTRKCNVTNCYTSPYIHTSALVTVMLETTEKIASAEFIR